MMTPTEQLAQWMIEHSFATGHGDKFTDLLNELSWQVAELRAAKLAAPVLSEDTQLFEELWDWFNAPNGWGDGTGVWEKVEQRLAQPAAPKEQP